MIRKVDLEDAKAITAIYNEYVINSTATFETEPVAVEDMRERITQISANFPYFVYEIDNEVVGYCYAPSVERKSRISIYIRNNSLLIYKTYWKRYRATTHAKTHREVSREWLSCADCLHNERE